jgi:hypothetical protein
MRYRSAMVAMLLATLTAVPSTLALAASAKDITLKRSDLPAGFHQTTSRSVSNAQTAQKTGVPRAQFDQHGRITGYDTDFTTAATVGAKAYVGVGSRAYTYKMASGAHWDFTKAVAVNSAKGKRVAIARVGEESTALTAVQTYGKTSYTIALVIFRRGATDMTVVVIAGPGHNAVNDALHYARVMDARAAH